MPEPVSIPPILTYAIPVFVLLILVEMLALKWGARGRYDAADAAASLSMGLGNRAFGLLTAGIKLTLFFAVSQFALFDIPWAWWSLILCFLGEDLAYYWFHRVAHERRWFWASHVVHHTSQHYNLTTALRQTWTGDLSLSFVFWLPLALIGFPVEMIFMFIGISLVYQFWIHTETIGKLGPLEWVFNTPSHHRVHHATNPYYLDSNYAGVLIIWDRLFGTFVEEDEKPTYGILSNLGTLNPLRIAFHEWAGIARDLVQARSLREAWGYVMGPPGWRPDSTRRTSADVKAAWVERQRATAAATPPAQGADWASVRRRGGVGTENQAPRA